MIDHSIEIAGIIIPSTKPLFLVMVGAHIVAGAAAPLTARERGLMDRILLGSVRTTVLRGAKCSVLIAPTQPNRVKK